MIPRKIHYCWFGPKPYPKLVKKCIETWKVHFTDYEFYLWNEENSPMDFHFVKEAYKARKYAFVSDYIRFWALYQYGGIYLDTDMFVIKGFDDLLNNDFFLAWETGQKEVLSCGVIGSLSQNEFVGSILMHYDNLEFNVNSITELVIPRIVNKCYINYHSPEYITIYPFDYFYPFAYEEKENVRRFLLYKTENTYAIHLWNISWGTSIDKLRDLILYYLKKIWRKAI